MTTDLPLPPSAFSKLAAMPRKHVIVDYPRLDDEGKPVACVALRALSSAEYANALAHAAANVRAQFKDLAHPDAAYHLALDTELKVQELLRAVRDDQDPDQPAFPSANDLRASCSKVEAAALYFAYLEAAESLGCRAPSLSAGEVDAWLSRFIAAEGNDPEIGAKLPKEHLRTLLIELARREAMRRVGDSEEPPAQTPMNEPGVPDIGALDVPAIANLDGTE